MPRLDGFGERHPTTHTQRQLPLAFFVSIFFPVMSSAALKVCMCLCKGTACTNGALCVTSTTGTCNSNAQATHVSASESATLCTLVPVGAPTGGGQSIPWLCSLRENGAVTPTYRLSFSFAFIFPVVIWLPPLSI